MPDNEGPQWAGAPLIHFSDWDRELVGKASRVLEGTEEVSERDRMYLVGVLAGLSGRVTADEAT